MSHHPGLARPLTLDEHRVGRRAVLSVTGEIDLSTVAQMRAAIEQAAATSSDIWLDFTGTTFMDSSGVHALVDARCRLAQTNRRLAVICPDGPVLRILALTGVDRTFEIHASRSAAHYAS